VEDDKVLADNLVEYLSNLGYSATATYGGRDGLRRFEQGEFKLDEWKWLLKGHWSGIPFLDSWVYFVG
jgi:CheY-like chemotaxis protein